MNSNIFSSILSIFFEANDSEGDIGVFSEPDIILVDMIFFIPSLSTKSFLIKYFTRNNCKSFL